MPQSDVNTFLTLLINFSNLLIHLSVFCNVANRLRQSKATCCALSIQQKYEDAGQTSPGIMRRQSINSAEEQGLPIIPERSSFISWQEFEIDAPLPLRSFPFEHSKSTVTNISLNDRICSLHEKRSSK